MPIKLDTFKEIDPKTTVDDTLPTNFPGNQFVYKDIDFDISYQGDNGNLPFHKVVDSTDLGDIRDVNAVKQSLTNLFNTRPGERQTNPFFGLDLSSFLFDPITTVTANTIGRAILEGIGRFEPRVNIDQLSVFGDPANGNYQITLGISFVDEHLQAINLQGDLSSGGFKFRNI